MSNSHLLTEQALKDWTGFSRRSDLEQWLRDLGIKPMRGKGGAIITTLDAVNDALRAKGMDFTDVEFEPRGQTKSH